LGNQRKGLSAEEDGVLVYCISDGSFGRAKPEDGSVVFVKGLSGADDDRVNVEAVPIGTFRYTAVSGAAKTVKAFQLR
jgi:hypothetical protein